MGNWLSDKQSRIYSIASIVNELNKNGFAILHEENNLELVMKWVAKKLGKIIQHDQIIVDGSKKLANTSGRLPWHTEKMYERKLPHFIVLGCIKQPLTGGKTLLLDSSTLPERIGKKQNFIGTVIQYEKENDIGIWPLFNIHPITLKPVIWYRQGKEAKVISSPSKIKIETIDKIIDSNLPTYAHTWKEGDILIIDNLRMLHAREAFEGERVLHRILVARK